MPSWRLGVRLNVAEFAREHGVSIRDRVPASGPDPGEGAWQQRSRRPRTSPRVTPPELDAWICKLRAELGWTTGRTSSVTPWPRIHARTGPAWAVPSRSTINRVLTRHDLLERSPAKRPRSSWRRFAYARPRDCYQIDATEVRLADGSHSGRLRRPGRLHPHPGRLPRRDPPRPPQAAVTAIGQAVTELRRPGDRAVRQRRGLHQPTDPTRIDLHVRPVPPGPRRPAHQLQPVSPTNLRQSRTPPPDPEEMAHAPNPPPTTLTGLQALLDHYRGYYNTQRRHSALPRRTTPAQAWTHAPTLGGPPACPSRPTPPCTAAPWPTPASSPSAGHRTSVGTAHAGTTVTAIRDGNHVTVYDPDGQPIGHLHLDPDQQLHHPHPNSMINNRDTSTGTSP